jgi:hypothetical protein
VKAVIIVTVCRRYHEFAKNVRLSFEQAKNELGDFEIIVVWARPELARLWLMQELMAEGVVAEVVGRPALPGEADHRPTTYPESHNIRAGLLRAKEKAGDEPAFFIVQAGDVLPNPGTYAFVKKHMEQGGSAALFHWANGLVHSGIWHTNFFAVSADPALWPPLAGPEENDVLEWKWGKMLSERAPPGVLRKHNCGNCRFVHSHDSERLEEFPVQGQRAGGSLPLTMTGRRRAWWARLWAWARGVWRRRRN